MDTIRNVINKYLHSKEILIDKIQMSCEVRKMCEQNACGQYNKNWTCPPAVDSIETIKQRIIQFNNCCVVYKIYDLKSTFDMKGILEGIKDFNKTLVEMKRCFNNKANYMVLGAGACYLCKKCTYVDGEKCRRPSDALISAEACGIDVIKLMKDNGLKYNNGKNTVTYIGLVFY